MARRRYICRKTSQRKDRLLCRTVDPGNRLLWRARLRRLESEVIRDSMLATSERFNSSMGGQPVPLKYRRDGVASFDMEKLPTPGSTWRRSVYLFQRRVYHLTVQGVFESQNGGLTFHHILTVFDDPVMRDGFLNAIGIAVCI